MGRDRISNLPDTIKDQILCCLPLKDAVRTSVLSSTWRYKWASISSLVFDDRFLARVSSEFERECASEIDHVLLLHSGPIFKFELSHARALPFKEFDKWIIHVSRHPLNELILKFSDEEPNYVVPSCIFSCQNLTRLELCACELKLPSKFKGFKNLKTLYLEYVESSQDMFETLISGSPVLENLTLNDIKGVDQLNINGPSLRSFYLEGDVADITLKSTFNLAVFSIYIYSSTDSDNHSGNLVKLLAEMPQIERLAIKNCAIQYLPSGVVLEALPVPRFNLHHLSITVNLSSFDETSTLKCILRSVPNLQELHIEAFSEEDIINVWEADHWSYPFAHLRQVEISNFRGKQSEIGFIEFMLLTSPILKRMNVKFGRTQKDDARKFEIVKQVVFLKRVSPQAQIQII